MFIVSLNLACKFAAVLIGRTALGPAFALWFAPDVLLAYHLFFPNAQGLLRIHSRFTTTAREVWLTIDDGPDPTDTPRILALLAAHRARATFFLIGKNATEHPALLRAIAAAGHEIGHHTQTHPLYSFWCARPARLHRELTAGFSSFAVADIRPTRFRSPAGIKNIWLKSALTAHGLTCVGWSARGLERRYRDPAIVAQVVTRGLKPGAILLLHEGPRVPAPIRVEAIRLVLENLTAQGYRCVLPTAAQLPR
ncbi:MAG: polysaccharide deacetylase family protein [Undibacterium sp.]|nr:polysaccharide deacetylase family protein [Opitutaceae bacterium]